MAKKFQVEWWHIALVLLAIIILPSLKLGTQSTIGTGCLDPCPQSFRCVNYLPLDDAPANFVSRITEGGQQCVLKEEVIESWFSNPTPIEQECTNNVGMIVFLDGVIIEGGYNYEGRHSGGCWAKAGSGESNQRCTEAGGTINAGDFQPENCPSDCHLITPSQEYYIDLPFCYSLCGNGINDPGENCLNCPGDMPEGACKQGFGC